MTASTAAPIKESIEDEQLPEPPAPDIEVILPEPGRCTINGMDCRVQHLKARQFFRLMGIVTQGLGPSLQQVEWTKMDVKEVGANIAVGLALALPYQMDEFLRLVSDIVVPANDSTQAREELREHMQDPEIDDLLPVIDAIIMNEQETIKSFVGKARAYMVRWRTVFPAAGAKKETAATKP